jgi:hypothetical protein
MAKFVFMREIGEYQNFCSILPLVYKGPKNPKVHLHEGEGGGGFCMKAGSELTVT